MPLEIFRSRSTLPTGASRHGCTATTASRSESVWPESSRAPSRSQLPPPPPEKLDLCQRSERTLQFFFAEIVIFAVCVSGSSLCSASCDAAGSHILVAHSRSRSRASLLSGYS